MIDDEPQIPYNHDLGPLEQVLSTVRRPGDFSVHGALTLPMPRVDVDGVGMLAFPLPATQVEALIACAERAPYGRGEDTIVDTSVRRVWQIAAGSVAVGGKTWPDSLRTLLAAVASGLGCEADTIDAELYKLLIYDPDAFFLAHRDSEKAAGMFGTLLLQLPSAHQGGVLHIRHAAREVQVDLSQTDFSELGFAAFYADCEHEVAPVTAGHRVCLVFNLLRHAADDAPPLCAPLHDAEAEQAAGLLRDAFASTDAPSKLVWLLEHQYTRDGLAFAALKGADAAVAAVLRRAATASGCALLLGLVHIEESGPAEIRYRAAPRRGSRGYGHDYDREIEVESEDYEVVETIGTRCYIDALTGEPGEPTPFAALPLRDNELLPADSLDDEEPDEQRLLEATGNEGVSFERAYHRAAIMLWPRDREIDLRLQLGIGDALTHLQALLADDPAASSAPALFAAERIVAYWERHAIHSDDTAALHSRMLRCLQPLPATALVERFITHVVAREYNGGENAALAECLASLPNDRLEILLTALLDAGWTRCPRALCELLYRLASLDSRTRASMPLLQLAEAIVERLPGLANRAERPDWRLAYEPLAADGDSVFHLLAALALLGDESLQAAAVGALLAMPELFDPADVIVPALSQLAASGVAAPTPFLVDLRLWQLACDFLLARSEYPPATPSDWRQPVTLDCKCEDCRVLVGFANAANLSEQALRIAQQRRSHVEQQIRAHRLDMNYVTDKRGSPHTLIVSKTRGNFDRQCTRHARDQQWLHALASLAAGDLRREALCERITAATARQPMAPER